MKEGGKAGGKEAGRNRPKKDRAVLPEPIEHRARDDAARAVRPPLRATRAILCPTYSPFCGGELKNIA